MSTNFPQRLLLLALALAGTLAGEAGAVTITREFAGTWYDPAHSGHGFNFEIIGSGSSKNILGSWYTYDNSGNPTWISAMGPVVGDVARLDAWSTSGGAFGNSFDPDNVQVHPWGTLTVSFSSCTQGTVQFNPVNPGLAAGSIPITRLSMPYNTSCSGGISGDSSSATSAGEIVQFMSNTGVVASAQGKLKFSETASRTEFSAEAEDLPAGAYLLFVDGVRRGSIAVVASVGGSNGELEFRSPVEPGKVLLDFDPRGKLVQIRQGSTVFLTATLGTAAAPPPPPGGGSGSPPTGDAIYRLSIEPSGNNGPELKARLEQRADRVDFNVELEDLPAGTYGLAIGGVDHGTLVVRAVPGGTEGEREFRNPPEPGHDLLDFDPRGRFIDITSATGTVVLSGLFPNSPSGSVPAAAVPAVATIQATTTVGMAAVMIRTTTTVVTVVMTMTMAAATADRRLRRDDVRRRSAPSPVESSGVRCISETSHEPGHVHGLDANDSEPFASAVSHVSRFTRRD